MTSSLEQYQRGLQRALRGQAPVAADPDYVRALAGSRRLAVVQDVVAFWRMVGLERFCVLTVPWLKAEARFADDVRRFAQAVDLSPYMEQAGLQFLQHLTADHDAVVAALAAFELALHRTRVAPDLVVDMTWPCDPAPVLARVLGSEGAHAPGPATVYRVRIGRGLPGGYEARPLSA